MPQAISAIVPFLTGGTAGGASPNWMKLLLGSMTGAGEIGNILADRKRAELLSQENKWASLTPQQLSAKIAAATQPLSAGLTQSVGNVVQAQMGERGLAQAPGIYSASLASALAPFYQQNQDTALNAILRQMGIPIQEAALLPGTTDMGGLLKMLISSFSKPSGGGGSGSPVDWSAVPDITMPDTTVSSSGGSAGALG